MRLAELGDFVTDLLHAKFTKSDLGESGKDKEMVDFHCASDDDYWRVDMSKASAAFKKNPLCPGCRGEDMQKTQKLAATMFEYKCKHRDGYLGASDGDYHELLLDCPSCYQAAGFNRVS